MNIYDIYQPCKICKVKIPINKEEFVYDNAKQHFYHYYCYLQKLLMKKSGKKTSYGKKFKRTKWNKYEIEPHILDSVINTIKIQEEGYKYCKSIIEKQLFYRWLQYTYQVVSFPKYFNDKMDCIFDGTYKDLLYPIPLENLFEFWQMKLQDLKNNAEYMRRKGKVIDGLGRVNYDIAILISNYEHYLKWKQNNDAINEQARQEAIQKSTINYQNIITKHKESNKDLLNIESIIDEI